MPTYFLQEALVPARIGLRGELMERYEGLGRHIFRKKLRIALSRYFRSFQYQQSIIQGVTRFDLNLQPVGLVTACDRRWAMKHLSRMKKSQLATKLKGFDDPGSKFVKFDNLTRSRTIL
ncbi:ProQ/FINO family protein [Paracoccus sulfuroxidans]|uniref:ProQ/FINO family protein n=1 Tax=Paracoccus sulfuroxidans TaxID=384678 RepID=UPI0013150DC0